MSTTVSPMALERIQPGWKQFGGAETTQDLLPANAQHQLLAQVTAASKEPPPKDSKRLPSKNRTSSRSKGKVEGLSTPKENSGPSVEFSRENLESTGKAIAQQRLKELEAKIVFLQNEHSIVLAALHHEIEDLKAKNKDLQFKLVLERSDAGNGPTCPVSEVIDHERSIVETQEGHTGNQSPSMQVVEDLENNVMQLETELHDAKMRILFLSELLKDRDRQLHEAASVCHCLGLPGPPLLNHDPISSARRLPITNTAFPCSRNSDDDIIVGNRDKFGRADSDELSSPPGTPSTSTAATLSRSTSTSTPTPPPEYLVKLQEAEATIARLQSENTDQKQELRSIRSEVEKSISMRFRGCNHPPPLKLSPQHHSQLLGQSLAAPPMGPLDPLTTARIVKKHLRRQDSQKLLKMRRFSSNSSVGPTPLRSLPRPTIRNLASSHSSLGGPDLFPPLPKANSDLQINQQARSKPRIGPDALPPVLMDSVTSKRRSMPINLVTLSQRQPVQAEVSQATMRKRARSLMRTTQPRLLVPSEKNWASNEVTRRAKTADFVDGGDDIDGIVLTRQNLRRTSSVSPAAPASTPSSMHPDPSKFGRKTSDN